MASKEDVINYVMTTPSNPNRAVLEGMLDAEQSSKTVEFVEIYQAMGANYTSKDTFDQIFSLSQPLSNYTQGKTVIGATLKVTEGSLPDGPLKSVIDYKVYAVKENAKVDVCLVDSEAVDFAYHIDFETAFSGPFYTTIQLICI